jgi:hypothetical protein
VLLSQDRRREGTFTFSLLPSEIAFILSIINNNLVTMKDYFSMSKSSVSPEGAEGLLIRVQPNTYIEKTEHFRTALHLVKQRGQLNKGYNTQEVWEIQPSFASIYCVFSGLHEKPHWQDFPSNQSVIKELVKCKTKQSCLRSISASRGPHLIPGELLSVTEQDSLFQDLLKEHVNHMDQTNLLKELIHQIKDNKLLSDHGNAARTSSINGGEKTRPELMMRLRAQYHWKVQQIRM